MAKNQPKWLPYGQQRIDDDDVAAVIAVLRGDWLTTGPAVENLERQFAAAVGASHAAACSSATAGLHLAMLALGVGQGDAVIVPSLTFVATANAARYVGADVVFADVDRRTGLMGPAHLSEAFQRAGGRRVRAVLPVHMNGQSEDLEGLAALAAGHGAVLVEDAAHAVGATYRRSDGRSVAIGSCLDSAMAVFSLHPVKTITMGEGGVVTTNDPRLAERLRRMRSHGLVRDPAAYLNRGDGFTGEAANPWYYELHELGFNYRATDIQCALGSSQLNKLPQFVHHRRRLVARYDRRLRGISPHVTVLPVRDAVDPAWHLAVVLVDFAALGLTRTAVMRSLAERAIGSQVHYIPVHRQPYYRAIDQDLELPGADAYYARCLSLPLSARMSEEDVDRAADALIESCGLQAASGR